MIPLREQIPRRTASAGLALGAGFAPGAAFAPVGPAVVLAVAVAIALAPAALAQSAGGYGDYVAWEDWARIVPGERATLVSSWDRSGGDVDANHYEFPPGLIYGDLDVIAARLVGPGIIYRFWMPHRAASEPFAVRMFFDGDATPRIDTYSDQILDGLFGYFADPLVTTFAGGQVCYEPIVFRDSLRIETENRAGTWHWYQYNVRQLPPGTEVTSYTGTLDAEAQADRLATITMFQNVGQHPAGESATAVRNTIDPGLVPAGGALTLADLAGPGTIRRLNVRMDGATDAELDSLHLKVFYDGRSEAAIDAPVSWFFGAGEGRAPYRSLPLGTDSPDGFYSYWPMPFRAAARVELVNVSAAPIGVDSTVVEHEPGPVGDDAGYLHAVTAKTIVEPPHDPHVLLSVTGVGHYVGNLLTIRTDHETHYFLEGDDVIVVDGTETLPGTGVEDAYNGGFYYNWVNNPMDEPEGPSPPFAIRPLCGILRVERTGTPPFGRTDQYRWQIADRVPFTESIEVSVENQYCWAGTQWISVAFWYELPPVASDSRAPSAGGSGALGFELRQNTPNPVGETTALRFSLSVDGPIVLDVLDVRGRRIETLIDGPRIAGPHEIRWNPGRLPNGVYFFRLAAEGVTATRKLVLLR